MLHEVVLRKHFTVTDRKGWVALEAQNAAPFRSFGTRRIAKLVNGHRFLFTIGETQRGKANALSAALEEIISQAGLAVLSEPSTSGQLRGEKLYRGFNLSECSSETLEQILEKADAAIRKSG